MTTNQPKWKYVGHIGDVDPIAHGGGFVYEDTAGVYCPEMTYFETLDDGTWEKMHGNTPVTTHRVLIERDSTREWWYAKLSELVSYSGQTLEFLHAMANGSTMERADLYQLLISYYGVHEFDSTPVTMTEGKAYFRYWRETRRSLRGDRP